MSCFIAENLVNEKSPNRNPLSFGVSCKEKSVAHWGEAVAILLNP